MFSDSLCRLRSVAVAGLLLAVGGYGNRVLLAQASGQSSTASAVRRPNILWITVEDMSPTLGCYGDKYAQTPNIDRLAQQSVRYTHAFASAPVCSPARSCLIHGYLATTTGTHNMRSAFAVPEWMHGFPARLRQAGYYTANNVKTDYNTSSESQIIEASWDASSDSADWRGRQEGQPFFSVINLMTTHQSRTMVWSYEQFQRDVQSQLSAEQIHDPAEAPLPPYYPDTPLIRKTVARFYDCVTVMDKQVGEILQRLEDDGLADETIVFFFSDHGSGMPRHKRLLLDSGTHVPLLARFPERYRDWAPVPPGKSTDRLVAFEDFGPTMLSLAGLPEESQTSDKPDTLEGLAFLGPREKPPRNYVHGHRDRIDEVVDMARSVRDQRYLYIRNYMPHLSYNQPSAWADQGEVLHEFYRLADPRTMTAAQWHFAGPKRPLEELYDCRRDPHNVTNLAEAPEQRDVLRRMRDEHRRWVVASRDLGFLPETQQATIAVGSTPYEWARREKQYDVEAIQQAASLVGTNGQAAFARMLQDPNPAIRYWGAVGCSACSTLSDDALATLTAALVDTSEVVRGEAAGALVRHGRVRVALPVLIRLLRHDDPAVVLYAARTVELLGARASAAHADIQALAERFRDEPGDPAWFIRFTTSGYLARVQPTDATTPPDVATQGKVPSDAIVIFAGGSTAMLAGPDGSKCKWPVREGALQCDPQSQQRQQGLWTRLHFRDAQIHAEFLVPETGKKGGGAGNSGLYLHGLFEQQILDSFQNPTRPMEMVGAVYGIRPPLVNAARPPEQWQVYDILFRAPRRNEKGEPVEAGSITTLLNGVLVQQDTSFTRRVSTYTPLYFRATPYAVKIRESLLRTGCGPLQLQDHDNPVRFRNIWIRPLDDEAFVFDPQE
jgi:N-sulfoglucosamine sulfohydrolase